MDLLLIDNSNIFIETKNLVGPEGRFDYDKFEKNYTNSDIQKKILVGSTPPKSDTFWSTMKNKGYEVYTFERKSSGEKAVDSKIIAKGVSYIVQQEHPATLNLLSGDFDMFPLIEEALEKNWNVNLWSWKDSLSKDYLGIEEIEIKYLDDVAENLIYFNYENNGYAKKEYFKEREARCERERQEWEFNQAKQNIKNKISRFQYLTDKDNYLSKIDALTDFEKISEVTNILSSAQKENDRLKKIADDKAAEVKRQKEEQERQNQETEKQNRKEFWKQNWGWVVATVTTAAGGVVYVIKKITK